MLTIGGLIPFTTIDYPGRLAAVIFCQGCPWRCGYCHNKHLISAKGSHVQIEWQAVLELLTERRGLLDGVVFSGGEPTMQKRLPQALATVHEMGFLVGLHTAGAYPERLADCLPFLDWVGMDLKAPFDCYDQITGVAGSGKAAQQSADLLRASGVSRQFRTTLDPCLMEDGRLQRLKGMVAGWGEELVIQQLNSVISISDQRWIQGGEEIGDEGVHVVR